MKDKPVFHSGEYKPMDATSYNENQHKKAMEDKKNQLMSSIASMELRLKNEWAQPVPITKAMDLLEAVISACGGEPKVHFLEVGRNFVILATRVPMSANLFPFIEGEIDNPRFHKIVTKLILQSSCVDSVRWMPGDTGSKLVVSIKGGV